VTNPEVRAELDSRLRVSKGAVIIAGLMLLMAAMAVSHYWLRPLASKPPPLPVLDTLGGEFTIPSTVGRDVSLSDFRGQIVLMTFGYTTCPTVCPTVLAKMRAVLRQIPTASQQIQPLFVTIDPHRDELEKLKPYLAFFDTTFIGLSGSQSQLDQIADRYKVHIERQVLDSAMDYGFSHNDHIYLLDQDGRVRATFGSSVKAEKIVANVNQLLATDN
jgi:protein SCO1